MSEDQIVDSAIKRIEYKIEKAVPKTDREVVEKEVELKNIKQLINELSRVKDKTKG